MQNLCQTPITVAKAVILGIDPGSITGYGVLRVLVSGGYEPIDFGCVRAPTGVSLADKWLSLFNALEELLDRYSPTCIVVETQFVHKNVRAALQLAMARAIVLLAGARRKIPIHEYAPKQAKLAVVGHGSASKEQVQKMVQMLLKLPSLPKPEDAADALALAICHAHRSRGLC